MNNAACAFCSEQPLFRRVVITETSMCLSVRDYVDAIRSLPPLSSLGVIVLGTARRVDRASAESRYCVSESFNSNKALSRLGDLSRALKGRVKKAA